MGAPRTLSTAVIIATKGRPRETANLLETLALQTVLPDVIVVSACDSSDIDQCNVPEKNVQVLFGPPGLAAQRNRALSLLQGKFDIVIFFDDDFVPSRFWIERIQMLLTTQPDIGGVTGRILVDGVTVGELEWSDGQSIVNNADSSTKVVTMDDQWMKDHTSPIPRRRAIGCNMAFRVKAIQHLKFDERLVLYGWLEDRDFGVRAGTVTKMIFTDLVWGVHLGTRRGRTSDLRFGYAQVVNPWYLMKKGTMKPFEACENILRGLSRNFLGVIFRDATIDRYGRLKGNLIGVKDIMLGHWAPEKMNEL
jgi:GT2 family glycosyltransferase